MSRLELLLCSPQVDNPISCSFHFQQRFPQTQPTTHMVFSIHCYTNFKLLILISQVSLPISYSLKLPSCSNSLVQWNCQSVNHHFFIFPCPPCLVFISFSTKLQCQDSSLQAIPSKHCQLKLVFLQGIKTPVDKTQPFLSSTTAYKQLK